MQNHEKSMSVLLLSCSATLLFVLICLTSVTKNQQSDQESKWGYWESPITQEMRYGSFSKYQKRMKEKEERKRMLDEVRKSARENQKPPINELPFIGPIRGGSQKPPTPIRAIGEQRDKHISN
tara:strand:- start:647 stop:1015 length:369 start_codon:yes stop_codon:yes gene_type:complete